MSTTETLAEARVPVPALAGLPGPDAPLPLETLTDPERALKRTLHLAAMLYFALAALALLGAVVPGPWREALRQPPWVDAAAGRAAVLMLLCMYAGGDPRRRGGLAHALAAALIVSAAAGTAYAVAGVAGAAAPWVLAASVTLDVLVASLVLQGARAAREARAKQGAPDWPDWTQGLEAGAIRVPLVPVALAGAALAAAAAVGPFTAGLRQVFAEPLLAAHAAGWGAALALAALYVAHRPRQRLPAASVVSAGLVLTALAGLLALVLADRGAVVTLLGWTTTVGTLMWVTVLAEAALAIGTWLVKNHCFRRWLKPRFLSPGQYRTLIGLSDVLVLGPERAVPAPEVARNVDQYVAKIRTKRKWVQRAALVAIQAHPVLYLKAPLSELDQEGRLDHLKRHFFADVLLPLLPDVFRRLVQAVIRIGKQVTYVGYYNDPRAHATVGYRVFEARPRAEELRTLGLLKPSEPKLRVHQPDDVGHEVVDADICVIGSGAGGAVLAYQLAGMDPSASVVVLERGMYVPPKEFVPDEVEMIGKLYSDGAFQQTEDFRFTVLQGSCVGGSTVINNAVSFATPDHVLRRWNEELRAGIDADEYRRSTEQVKEWLKIRSQDEGTPYNPHNRLNPSFPKYLEGVARLGLTPEQLRTAAVDANIAGCLGCGYCNIGCRYGAKLSMLETALPWAQRDFGADRVRIFSEAPVQRIATDGAGRATEAVAKLPDGRTLRVRARKFVVAAGPIASSYLLKQSRIGAGLPVGRHVSFNLGAPFTAEFDDPMDAFDGLQISHFGVPRPERGWVYETWFNPPVSQAVNMPGWFEDHYHNMRAYRRLMAVGVLVGTERNGSIGDALTGGAAVHYRPTDGDRRKLADALMELGQILFAAGARRLMLNSWRYLEFTHPNMLAQLPAVALDPYELTLGTGHPQGGNAVSRDPSLGVVDPGFRVHGYQNLFVCDASVFPTSTTVNPQLTVMALAHYAAPRIHEAR
ncbi:MAG TPA: GMC family oxidoreductase [Longimicrobium sp.]|jgi:choline dehydrogenase-like flavoprotein